MIMDANLQLKYKMHIVYEVMRGGRRVYCFEWRSGNMSIHDEQRKPFDALLHHTQIFALPTSTRRRPP